MRSEKTCHQTFPINLENAWLTCLQRKVPFVFLASDGQVSAALNNSAKFLYKIFFNFILRTRYHATATINVYYLLYVIITL